MDKQQTKLGCVFLAMALGGWLSHAKLAQAEWASRDEVHGNFLPRRMHSHSLMYYCFQTSVQKHLNITSDEAHLIKLLYSPGAHRAEIHSLGFGNLIPPTVSWHYHITYALEVKILNRVLGKHRTARLAQLDLQLTDSKIKLFDRLQYDDILGKKLMTDKQLAHLRSMNKQYQQDLRKLYRNGETPTQAKQRAARQRARTKKFEAEIEKTIDAKQYQRFQTLAGEPWIYKVNPRPTSVRG